MCERIADTVRPPALVLFALLALGAPASAQHVAYIRGASAPWSSSTNEQALTQAFGVGGWSDLRMSGGAAPFATGTANDYDVIFLEGSDSTANELSSYLGTHMAAITAWVQQGGSLLVNAAPNQGGSIAFPFGVTLNYSGGGELEASAVTAAAPPPPFVQGPFVPIASAFFGSSFSHATVSGSGLTPLLVRTPQGDPVLAEGQFGSGRVLFGGMTTANFHSPQPQAQNLRANILCYTASQGGSDADADGWADSCDNCPAAANPSQANCDGDAEGDACDPDGGDSDGDGWADGCDNCPALANPTQADRDGNGLGDACNDAEDADGDDWADDLDNCPADANPTQADCDGDTLGNACDPDAADVDGDGVPLPCDNCPTVANPDQQDGNGNGVGDACGQSVLDSGGCYRVSDTISPPDGNEPTYVFEDISATGVVVPIGSHTVSAAQPIGFSFDFYGNPQTQLFVSSNGFVSFLVGQGEGCCGGGPLPNPAVPNGVITGLWAHLHPNGSNVYRQTLGMAPARRFIVQFQAVENFVNGASDTWQVVLFEGSGEIVVRYASAQVFAGATAGIENATGRVGFRWAGPGAVTLTGEAVRYAPTSGLVDDGDGDAVADCLDNCPAIANVGQQDTDLDGYGNACDACAGLGIADGDGDGFCDGADNCPLVANPQQSNCDFDALGDACDPDAVDGDGDQRADVCDNCPAVANADQLDSDFDGFGDACDACVGFGAIDDDGDGFCGGTDNCPFVANPQQRDCDFDGLGDACDPDAADLDGDQVATACDNCPTVANPDQQDGNGNGVGDACGQSVLDSAGCYRVSDTISPPDGNEPTYVFEDIAATGVVVPIGSHTVSAAQPIGFSFNFYGTPQTQLFVSSNGFVSFLDGQGEGCCGDGTLPDPFAPNALITGLWAHLHPNGSNVYRQTLGTAPARRFIVQFQAVDNFDNGSSVTWQIVLFEGSGEIVVRYASAPVSAYGTAGIENATGRVGFRWAGPAAAALTGEAVGYAPTSGLVDDGDGDAVVNCVDNCPSVANLGQQDTDLDGFGDACDTCAGVGIADGDGDGLCDETDNCPLVANPQQSNCDFDALGDACDPDAVDGDGDQRADPCDNCPAVANADQLDSDFDGFGDACDACFGFGAADADADGVCDGSDNCPLVSNPAQRNCDFDAFGDACDPDAADVDGDQVATACDNCPAVANPNQQNGDFDTLGDACDPCVGSDNVDADGDAICNSQDNCFNVANPAQTDCDFDGAGDACDADAIDGDGDQVADACDNCPAVVNPDQQNGDFDSLGDACDPCVGSDNVDADGDAICNSQDNCFSVVNPAQSDCDFDGTGDACDADTIDGDGDLVADACDNCPAVANPAQIDLNGDQVGEVCATQGRSDTNGCYRVWDTLAPPDGSEPAVDFTDIAATGTVVNIGSHTVSTAIPLGFTFQFYGASYSQLFVSSNGFVSFTAGQGEGCCGGRALPAVDDINGVIAGFWSHLHPTVGRVRHQLFGSAPARRFVLQFTDVRDADTGFIQTWQLVLLEGSNEIQLQYADARGDGFDLMTAGIESPDGRSGLRWAGPGPVTLVDQAVRYVPTASLSGDQDADGVVDCLDSCPSIANPNQEDRNGDGEGDACDQGELDSAGCYRASDTLAAPDGSEPIVDFVDIAVSGTNAGLGPHTVGGPFPIGFPYQFYGVSYSQVFISSNGFLSFLAGQGEGCCGGSDLPNTSVPNGLIAGLWGHLHPVSGSVRYQTIGSAPARRFITQFTSVDDVDNGALQTWQIVLFEGSNDIVVQYADASALSGTGSAGIESPQGTIGLRWAGPGAVTLQNQAVRYAPTAGLNTDQDSDGVPDCVDVCPAIADPAQGDGDGDGLGDACDPCTIDGVVAGAEACDDGNALDADCCTNQCVPRPGGTSCLEPGATCALSATCDGAGACAAALLPAGTVCRPSGGDCDPAEQCDGSNQACPVDQRLGSGTVCRPGAGECDPEEVCDGFSIACPANQVFPNGTECRAQQGACDLVERCNGISALCPADAKRSGTLCRAAAGVCDVAESCDGVSSACPEDAFVPNGASCDDGAFCNGVAQCQQGSCAAAPAPCPLACDEGGNQCVNACPDQARAGCRTADKSILVITDKEADARDRLVWKWLRGQATSAADFGDPTLSADNVLCLYAGSAQALLAGGEVMVPADGTRWSPVDDRGYKYRDAGASTGVQYVTLRSGAPNRAKVLFGGKGAALPDPTVPLIPDQLPLVVQLMNSDTPVCWQSTFAPDDVVTNQSGRFRARTP